MENRTYTRRFRPKTRLDRHYALEGAPPSILLVQRPFGVPDVGELPRAMEFVQELGAPVQRLEQRVNVDRQNGADQLPTFVHRRAFGEVDEGLLVVVVLLRLAIVVSRVARVARQIAGGRNGGQHCRFISNICFCVDCKQQTKNTFDSSTHSCVKLYVVPHFALRLGIYCGFIYLYIYSKVSKIMW